MGTMHNLTLETAVNILRRGVQLAQTQAFHWTYIDRPNDGSLHLVFLMPQAPGVPPDGIRYLEKDVKVSYPGGQDLEVEVIEAKNGYIPGLDQVAQRVRRLYRLSRGGHPSLLLIHYSRSQPAPVPPHLLNIPARQYPLRPVNEPPYVPLGPQQQQQQQPGPQTPQRHNPAAAAHLQQRAAMLQQQSQEQDQRERQRVQMAMAQIRMPDPDYDSGDEATAHISARALALMRFRKNHELMNEVFNNAAKLEPAPPPAFDPAAGFTKEAIDAATAKLEQEVEQLQARAAARRAGRSRIMDDMVVDEVTVS
ncbi:hypothetical protein AURDEDRAFT_84049 [Auricularia subglabra TFB-10046 SS5]|nr:hypothetical protein AURDEDRAFT_84049 [Auricularia subglabra TFB-10046 SS5]